VECTAHLPGLLLPTGGSIVVGDGELTELSFDAWQALESEFGYAARRFERSRPAFFRLSVSDGPVESDFSLEEIAGAFGRVRTVVHRALLLATASPLPEPALSATYITRGPAVWRLIGPYGREHILYAARPGVELDAEGLRRLRPAHAILAAEAALPREGALEAAFGTLERTTRPEFTALNRFIHEMIALEQLLMPDERTLLTETFARRVAVQTVAEHDQLEEAVEIARLLYRARSELVHGGDLDRVLERWDDDLDQLLGLGRWVVCEVLGRVAAWRATAPAGASRTFACLRAELDDAARAPDRWEALSRRWELAT
jgi:hypothetical protein